MTDPSVLTIILNFRTPELTLKALDAALREMAGIRGEILVVDNGSGDDSCEVLTRGIEGLANPPVPVRFKASARNGGFGAGNNFGMHAGLSDGTQPDFYYILNSDAFPQKGAIRNLIAHMQTHRHCGIAGSAIRGVDGEPHQTAFRFPTIAGEFEGAGVAELEVGFEDIEPAAGLGVLAAAFARDQPAVPERARFETELGARE